MEDDLQDFFTSLDRCIATILDAMEHRRMSKEGSRNTFEHFPCNRHGSSAKVRYVSETWELKYFVDKDYKDYKDLQRFELHKIFR